MKILWVVQALTAGLCLIVAVVSYVGPFVEYLTRKDPCPCRRTCRGPIISVGAPHQRARWMLISAVVGAGGGNALLWNFPLPTPWWLTGGFLFGFACCGWNAFYEFIWHEFPRWRRGLRAAKRWLRHAVSIRKVVPA